MPRQGGLIRLYDVFTLCAATKDDLDDITRIVTVGFSEEAEVHSCHPYGISTQETTGSGREKNTKTIWINRRDLCST
jgi:hypothetical protein